MYNETRPTASVREDVAPSFVTNQRYDNEACQGRRKHEGDDMKRLMGMIGTAAIALATGCGGPTYDNVAACKKFLTSIKCGSADPSGYVACDNFTQYNCDVASYFDCASTKFVCTSSGMYDPTKLLGLTDCAPKLTCK
jgi:hypothetical protein